MTTRQEMQDRLTAEFARLLRRDADRAASPAQFFASWACELTDLLGWPVVVTAYGTTMVAYMLPTPLGASLLFAPPAAQSPAVAAYAERLATERDGHSR